MSKEVYTTGLGKYITDQIFAYQYRQRYPLHQAGRYSRSNVPAGDYDRNITKRWKRPFGKRGRGSTSAKIGMGRYRRNGGGRRPGGRKRKRRRKRGRRGRGGRGRYRGGRGGLRRFGYRLQRAMIRPDVHVFQKKAQFLGATNKTTWIEFLLNRGSELQIVMDKVSAEARGRMFVNKTVLHVVMRNNNNMPFNMQIYWCRPRWLNAVTPLALVQAIDATYSDVTDLERQLWFDPSMIPEVTRQYRIKRGRVFTVQPGSEFAFTMSNRRTWQYITQAWERTGMAIGKPSKVAMIKMWGPVGVDDADNGIIGTANLRVDCIITSRYHFSHPADPVHDITETASTLGTMVSWKGMEFGDPTAAEEVQAT